MSNYSEKRLSGLIREKGKTYEERYGIEKAKEIREKMRLAKLGKKRPFKARLCIRKENHYKWKSNRDEIVGRHTRGLHDPEYKQWRRSVLERDNFKCKISDTNCKGRLEVHHILTWKDYPELRYQINNGICLCHAHHPIKRAEEKRLAPYFNMLVSVSK